MVLFVVLLTYLKPLEEMDRLRPAHLAYLDIYYEQGIFLASGRQTPPKGGVIIAHANSREQLEAILAKDPFATEKAASYEIIAFNATKHAQILNGLFAGK